MKASDVRQKYFDFFTDAGRKHKLIAPSPLVPENDPSTLFTSAGMQPLIPYLKGEPHPMGKRLVDSQPSIRLQDIEEVGDTCHTTFFEMLGNWSLGDYFKKEQLSWFLEFLTKVLKLPKEKLYVSVFEGDKIVPKDTESAEIWKRLGIPKERIVFYGAEKNWWSRSGVPENMPAGEIGGPDSEVFYDFGPELKLHENSPYKNKKCDPACPCGRFLEIGNSVFMQYEKQADSSLKELPNKNVDFGGGLERLTAATINNPDVFKIDIFWPIIEELEKRLGVKYNSSDDIHKPLRIIADHIKASIFLISGGVKPSNKQQGYVLRRLLRRSAYKSFLIKKDFSSEDFKAIVGIVFRLYPEYFKGIDHNSVNSEVSLEIRKFRSTIERGLKEINKYHDISGKIAFDLYQTYGFPLDLTLEIIRERGKVFNDRDKEKFEEEFKKHQGLSRTASAGMFKGGLENHSEQVTKLHTATHLLHAALRQILGPHVHQVGSNITAERLRFDFTHPEKLASEQLDKIQETVNEKIKENLPVTMKITTFDEAVKAGALAFFGEKYGEKVKVYSIGPSTHSARSGRPFSVEVCGGPHASSTGMLGRFTIIKEEAVGAGKRRIYAKLE